MLITSNTIAPILDASGRPLAGGTLSVRLGSTEQSEPAKLFKRMDFQDAEGNPITLNSAGEIPGPVWAKVPKGAEVIWCFAYDRAGKLIRTYPLASVGIGMAEEEDGGELAKRVITATEKLMVQGKAFVNGSLDVNGDLIVRDNVRIEETLFANSMIKTDGNLIGADLELYRSFYLAGQEFGIKYDKDGKESSRTGISGFNKSQNVNVFATEEAPIDIDLFSIGSYTIMDTQRDGTGNDFKAGEIAYDYGTNSRTEIYAIKSRSYQENRASKGKWRVCGVMDSFLICYLLEKL